MMEDYHEEEHDEFLDYYHKYRRRQSNPRSSFSQPRSSVGPPHLLKGDNMAGRETYRTWGGPGQSDTWGDTRSVWEGGTESRRGETSSVWEGGTDSRSVWGGSSEAGTASSSGYSSQQGGGARQRFVARSKSHGRDPRMVDLLKVYGGKEQVDTISRDSGNSSGGTPESNRRGMVATRSGVTKAEVYNNNYRGHNVDSLSLQDNDRDHNYDSMSLRSLDSQLLDWAPLGAECRKRKYEDFDKTVSDEDESIVEETNERLAKRPRTPDPRQIIVKSSSLVWRILCYLVRIFVTVVVIIVLLISVVTYRNYNCSSQMSQPLDLAKLTSLLKPISSQSPGLQGQHVATHHILESLGGLSIPSSSPVLVIVLQGGVGNGKTFAANLIADSFPVQSNVHRVLGSFGASGIQVDTLTSALMRSCGPNLLILDDVDSMEENHIDLLEQVIVGISKAEGRTNRTLVVLTTGVGGTVINQFMLDRVRKPGGLASREKLTRKELLDVFDTEKVNFPLVSSLTSLGMDVEIIPFLPLTRDHVRSCLLQTLRQAKATVNRDEINGLLDQLVFFSPQFPVFSATGCKQVAAKVGLLLGGRQDR